MTAIHHTEAIVVRSEPSGEANKRVWLFTREFGLVITMMQGVRKPTAKLQGHVMDYSIIAADLIRGKSTWRLISAKVIESPIQGKEREPLSRVYVRTVSFLERFLVGEGIHEELFQHVTELGNMIKKEYDPKILDALSLWKVLALLGYIAIEEDEELFFSLPLSEAVALVDDVSVKKLIKNATDAIISSHL
ncbi:MAG: recombination protein O N-terminal domain-containing protein [Candidatus Paceibacterota bacterium]